MQQTKQAQVLRKKPLISSQARLENYLNRRKGLIKPCKANNKGLKSSCITLKISMIIYKSFQTKANSLKKQAENKR